MLVKVLVAIVAAIHVVIALVEMVAFARPEHFGFMSKVYSDLHLSQAVAADVVVVNIVANAGLYNLFIAAGLFYTLFGSPRDRRFQIFFLICVIIAGVFGTMTLKTWVPIVFQSASGSLALLAVWLDAPPRQAK